MSKSLLLTALLALPLVTYAADGKKPTPQQEKMATCSKEASARQLKRDERNRFMSTCLSTKTAPAAPPAK